MLANEPQYGAWAWEIHHHTKKDAPSGTLDKAGGRHESRRDMSVRSMSSSNRAGAHPGTHEIGFDSAADTITLRHTARSREGFARGALKAAQWIVGKKRRVSNSAKFYLREVIDHVHRMRDCFGHSVSAEISRLTRAALRNLVRRQIEAGINFLVPCGTTGESPTLTRRGTSARGRDHGRRGQGQGSGAGGRRRI